MSAVTPQSAIAEALRMNVNLEKFCFFLHDRREDPRVTRADVRDQGVEAISGMLVSKFTSARAVEVTRDLLREMTCNEAADVLESRTKSLLDKGVPTFRRTSAGKLDTGPSPEALTKQNQILRNAVPAQTAKQVEAEARDRVRSECGNPDGDRGLLLSRCTLQFGQYKGQTFKWLLENHVQYAAYIITEMEEKTKTSMQSPLMDNKNSLRNYAMTFRDFRKVRSLHKAQDGNARVGFGKYKRDKLRDLYQSRDPERLSYLDYLRGEESSCGKGSPMEVAVDYILHRDDQQGASAVVASGGVARYPARGRTRQRTRHSALRSRRGNLR